MVFFGHGYDYDVGDGGCDLKIVSHYTLCRMADLGRLSFGGDVEGFAARWSPGWDVRA